MRKKMFVILDDIKKLKRSSENARDIYVVKIEYICGLHNSILCECFTDLYTFLIRDFAEIGFNDIEIGFLSDDGIEISVSDVFNNFRKQ